MGLISTNLIDDVSSFILSYILKLFDVGLLLLFLDKEEDDYDEASSMGAVDFLWR